jgi:hypothetical protein
MSFLRDEPCTNCGADVLVTSIKSEGRRTGRRLAGRSQRVFVHADARETVGDSQTDNQCNRPAKGAP